MTQRTEPSATGTEIHTWTYDTAPMGVGKLASATTGATYARTHTYDALGRPTVVQFTINGATHAIATTYDSASRVDTVTYPSGFAVAYSYNEYGYQLQLKNAANGRSFWLARRRDAELRLTRQRAGNAVETFQTFDALTGRLTSVLTGDAGAVQNFAYGYDDIGRMTSRSDANSGLSETFVYDALSRLTRAKVGVSPARVVTYDAIGNILSKSGVGTYAYPAPGQPRPHAVQSIAGSVINTTFIYDSNGNRTDGNGLTIGYTPFNKPASFTQGGITLDFRYDPERQRYEQVATTSSAQETTLYLADAMGSGIMVEKVTGLSGTVQWNNYLFAGGEMVGMRVEHSAGAVYERYFHKDHLGSVSTITDETGAVTERLSYDAWGKRRNPDGSGATSGSIVSETTRGFTGHEQLDLVGMVHMNGRVYDPLLGRFTSADPMTENPFSTQGWNRYSYVGNSPVNFTDPSGYCFLGCFWKSVLSAIWRAIKPYIVTVLRVALAATAAFICGPACAAFASPVTSVFVTGVSGGGLGQMLKAGLITAFTAAAFYGVGELTGPDPAFAVS
jgi:RHS repeat-associated protein